MVNQDHLEKARHDFKKVAKRVRRAAGSRDRTVNIAHRSNVQVAGNVERQGAATEASASQSLTIRQDGSSSG